MVEVLCKPILSYHLRWLANEGVTNLVLACGYKSEAIVAYCSQNPIAGLNIRFSFETEPLGRGGAAREAAKLLPYQKQPSIISQGDTITDIPIGDAWRTHRDSGAILTLIVVPYRSRFGVVDIGDDGFVSRFREKPRLPYWANAGTFIASPEFFDCLPERGDEDETIQRLAEQYRVSTFRTNHYWRSVDMQKDIIEAEADLSLPSLPHEDIYNPKRSV